MIQNRSTADSVAEILDNCRALFELERDGNPLWAWAAIFYCCPLGEPLPKWVADYVAGMALDLCDDPNPLFEALGREILGDRDPLVKGQILDWLSTGLMRLALTHENRSPELSADLIVALGLGGGHGRDPALKRWHYAHENHRILQISERGKIAALTPSEIQDLLAQNVTGGLSETSLKDRKRRAKAAIKAQRRPARKKPAAKRGR